MEQTKGAPDKILPDGTDITAYTCNVISCNLLELEAGTTGYMGGDTSLGGRSYFRIKDNGGTDMEVNTSVDRYSCRSLEVFLGDDCELKTIIHALKFITKMLEDEFKELCD